MYAFHIAVRKYLHAEPKKEDIWLITLGRKYLSPAIWYLQLQNCCRMGHNQLLLESYPRSIQGILKNQLIHEEPHLF